MSRLELVNSAEFQRKVLSKDGFVSALAANKTPHADNVKEIFLRVLARPPRSEETAAAIEFLEAEKNRAEEYASLLWSLLATNEFMFNH